MKNDDYYSDFSSNIYVDGPQRYLWGRIELDEGPIPDSKKIKTPDGTLQLGKIEFDVLPISSIKNLANIGRCIYCGSASFSSNENRPLTDEHIIPESIGGSLVLKHAACQLCMNAIQSYETRILSDLLFTPTKYLQEKRIIKYKRNKKSHALYARVDGQDFFLKRSIDEHPVWLAMPVYHPPKIFCIVQENDIFQAAGLWVNELNNTDAAWDSVLSTGQRTLLTPKVDTLRFAQFLAKIAHGIAIAAYGVSWDEENNCKIGSFECLLPPMILNKCDNEEWRPEFLDFVGCNSQHTPYKGTAELHKIGTRIVRYMDFDYILVSIVLYSNLGAPIYDVLAARRPVF